MGCGSSSAADTIENISSGRVNTKDGNEERNSRPFINKGRDTSSSKYHYDRINAQLYEDGDRKLDDDGKPALPPLKQPFRYMSTPNIFRIYFFCALHQTLKVLPY